MTHFKVEIFSRKIIETKISSSTELGIFILFFVFYFQKNIYELLNSERSFVGILINICKNNIYLIYNYLVFVVLFLQKIIQEHFSTRKKASPVQGLYQFLCIPVNSFFRT